MTKGFLGHLNSEIWSSTGLLLLKVNFGPCLCVVLNRNHQNEYYFQLYLQIFVKESKQRILNVKDSNGSIFHENLRFNGNF